MGVQEGEKKKRKQVTDTNKEEKGRNIKLNRSRCEIEPKQVGGEPKKVIGKKEKPHRLSV